VTRARRVHGAPSRCQLLCFSYFFATQTPDVGSDVATQTQPLAAQVPVLGHCASDVHAVPGPVIVGGLSSATQLPDVHCDVVHALSSPSLQAVPSAFAGFEQTPLAGLQVPASWH